MKNVLLVSLLVSTAPVFAMEDAASALFTAEQEITHVDRRNLIHGFMDRIGSAKYAGNIDEYFASLQNLVRFITVDECRSMLMDHSFLNGNANKNLGVSAHLNHQSPRYVTILDIAEQVGRADLVELLRRNDGQTGQERIEMERTEFVNRLMNAIQTGDRNEFINVIQAYAYIFNSSDYQPIAQQLLDRGFNVNMNLCDYFPAQGRTPDAPQYISILSGAILYNEADIVEFLIAQGARINLVASPLGSALASRSLNNTFTNRCRTIAILLDEGTPVSSFVDWNGEYPPIHNAQDLAFLLIYLNHLGKLEEFDALRDNEGQTLSEYIDQRGWFSDEEKEQIVYLLSNPRETATLYPELQQEFEKCQELRKHRVYRRVGSKGIQI